MYNDPSGSHGDEAGIHSSLLLLVDLQHIQYEMYAMACSHRMSISLYTFKM